MSAVKKKKKRRSQAPVALVYFVTVLIFMALLAALSIYLLKEYNILTDDSGDDDVVSSSAFTNLYARVNSSGALQDAAVIRVDPDEQKILVVPISAETVNSSDKTQTLRDVFEEGGMIELKAAVEETFGIEADNYMSVTNDAFERVADIFGGINYTADEELYYLSQDNDENDISIDKGELVTLSGRQIRLICQYPVFSSGKQGNMEFLGEALTELLNNAFQYSNIVTDNLDNIYQIITSNSDTDLTTDDFKLQKSYVKQMLASGLVPAEQLCPQGTWNADETFEVSSEFKAQLRESFAQDTEDVSQSTTEE